MNRSRGFTLIELLAVLVLLALMLLFASRILSLASVRSTQIQQQTDRLDAVAAVHRFLQQMIEHALPLPVAGEGAKSALFEGKAEQMMVVSTLPDSIGGGIYIQRLQLQGNALWISFKPASGSATGAPKPQRLLPGVSALHLAYRGIGPNGKMSGWLKHWPWPGQLPSAVRVALTTSGGEPWITQVIALRQQLSGNTGV